MDRSLKIILLITFLFGCSKGEQSKNNWEDIDQFQDWLFKQKRIESEIVFEAMEQFAIDMSTESEKTTYVNEDTSKRFIVFHNNGTEIRYIEYQVNNVKRNSIEYFRNGVATCVFPRNNSGKKHGKYYCYHEDGSIRIIGEYMNGLDLKNEVRYEKGEYRE